MNLNYNPWKIKFSSSSLSSSSTYIYILFHTKVLFHEFVFTEPDGQTDRHTERETVTQRQRQRDCVSE